MDDIADRAADATLDQPELLARGFREYRRYRVRLADLDGATIQQTRDVLIGGKVAAVLAVDLARDEIVLVRQFRLSAHIGNGVGDLVEIVAGMVERDETPAQAAMRECEEEIGVVPSRIAAVMTYFSSPGFTDEEVTIFLAAVDAAKVPASTVTGEEHLRTLRVPIDAAIEALAGNAIRNGPAIIALQWLALNRARLNDLLRA